MKTLKALSILSKGEKNEETVESPLAKHAARYKAEFEQREEEVLAKQTAARVELPFVKAFQAKLARAISTAPADNMPIVTRFDIYSSIRKIAERSVNDRGLKDLTIKLEKVWQAEPVGSLSYGEVRGLVSMYKDQFPRSKAADALEAEVGRVGMHKLPVAKLARIAKNIKTQHDYDIAMEVNGYASDRPEAIRARSFVRALVEMQGDSVHTAAPKKRDDRDMAHRVADRVEREAKMPFPPKDEEEELPGELEPEMSPLDEMAPPEELPGEELGAPLDMDMDPSAPPELESGEELLQEIQDVSTEIVNDAPPEALPFIEHEEAEGHHTAPVGTPTWGAEEVLLEGHESAPPSPEWMAEEAEEIMQGGPTDMPGDLPDEDMPLDLGLPPEEEEFPMQLGAAADSKKGKGIPLPPKAKSQPKVTTYMPKPNGGKVLKAELVEDAILAGRRVVHGGISIHINDKNEVELWNKNAGRACDLISVDTAIADFLNMVNVAKKASIKPIVKFAFTLKALVDVPCDGCGSVTMFEKAASESDSYKCECGTLIPATITAELAKIGLGFQSYEVTVQYSPLDKEHIIGMVQSVSPHTKVVSDTGKVMVLSFIADEGQQDVDLVKQQIEGLGGLNKIVGVKPLAEESSGEEQMEVQRGPGEAYPEGGPGSAEGFEPKNEDPADRVQSPGQIPVRKKKSQVGGPDAANQSELEFAQPKMGPGATPPALPTDKSPMSPGTEPWPAQDVQRQMSELAKGGMPDEQVLKQMVEMGAIVNAQDPFAQEMLNKAKMASKKAQALPPSGGLPPPVPGATAPAAPAQDDALPMNEVIQAALTNYKAQGMNLFQAMKELQKEHGERLSEAGAEAAGDFLHMAQELWTGGSNPGAGVAVDLGGSDAVSLMAAKKSAADSKMKAPSLHKPKDHVKVSPPGEDSSTKDLLPVPGKIKSQPGKPKGKLSDTNLGDDSSVKDLLPSPGKPSANHSPTSQSGTKLPAKKLDSDSEGNDPFNTPALKAEPKVKK